MFSMYGWNVVNCDDDVDCPRYPWRVFDPSGWEYDRFATEAEAIRMCTAFAEEDNRRKTR